MLNWGNGLGWEDLLLKTKHPQDILLIDMQWDTHQMEKDIHTFLEEFPLHRVRVIRLSVELMYVSGLNDLYRYDTESDEWTCLSVQCDQQSTISSNLSEPNPYPGARSAVSMFYHHNSQGIMIFGGENSNGATNELWHYDLVGNRWYALFTTPINPNYGALGSVSFTNWPPPRISGRGLVINGSMFYFGFGYDQVWQLESCNSTSFFNTSSLSCELCPSGKVSNIALAPSCYDCPVGTIYSSASGTCEQCEIGFYSNMSGSWNCSACEAGRYSSAKGASVCLTCLSGTFSASAGSSFCDKCAVGKFSSQNASQECQLCPLGSIAPTNGSISCSLCGLGRYSSSNGSISCMDCPVGSFAAVNGSIHCQECFSGKFSNSTGESTCINCTAGSFSSQNASICSSCLKGSYSTSGSAQCSPCSPGKFSSILGSTMCSMCSAGTVSSGGSSSCKDCVAGFYAALQGSSVCAPCDPGRFARNSAEASCAPCASGYFAANNGSVVCQSCPPSAVSASGSSKISDCYCPPTYFGYAFDNQTCTSCPNVGGLSCLQNNRTRPHVAAGYYRISDTYAYLCTPTEACQEAGYENQTTCSYGYEGFVCGNCVRYVSYRKGTSCISCPQKWVLALQIVAILLAIFVCLYKFATSQSGIAAEIKILFQSLQIIGVYPSLSLSFPSVLTETMNIVSITNINIEIFSPECTTAVTYWDKFILKQILPWISVTAVFLFSLLLKLLRSCRTPGAWKDILNVTKLSGQLLIIWTTISISLYSLTMSSWADVFNCRDQGDGTYLLVRNPAYKCYDETWNRYVPAIVIFGLMNLGVIPGLLLYHIIRIRNDVQSLEIQKKFAFIIRSYHPKYYYWELVFVLKRCLIFLALTMFRDGAVKYLVAVAVQFVFVFFDIMVMPFRIDDENRLHIT
jgi:hypothetical protein